MLGRREVDYGTQNLSQLGRAELAGSTGPVAVPAETVIGHEPEIKRLEMVANPDRQGVPPANLPSDSTVTQLP